MLSSGNMPSTGSPPLEENKKPGWKIPLLRLRVNDVSSKGSAAFFEHINVTTLLREAVVGVLNCLYTPETVPSSVRSVTLVLRSMGGVAYTTGSEIDDDHKEIHFSTDYIGGLSPERVKYEIIGVVRHEMVHCWQYNGKGTCPGGLIEGIADFVRLRDGLSPPHWKKGGTHWDEGYQVTAYFLDWCEQEFGPGFVKRLNGSFNEHKYSPEIWVDLSGATVEELWSQYRKQLDVETLDSSDHSDGDLDKTNHTSKGDSTSEDGSVDVVRREGASEGTHNLSEGTRNLSEGTHNLSEGIHSLSEGMHYFAEREENKLSLDQEATGDWLPEEKEALFLRHRLQRTFLPPDSEKPNVNEFPDADTYFTFLESMEDVPASILLKSKLPKVLKFISRLEDPDFIHSQYNFKVRARALVEKWSTTLPKGSGEDSPSWPMPPKGDELLSLQAIHSSPKHTVLQDQQEEPLGDLASELRGEISILRGQAELSPLSESDEFNHRYNTALVTQRHPSGDDTSDISTSDGGGETEYEQSYYSTTHESTVVSYASSSDTGSQTSDTVLSYSRSSTPRGYTHEKINRPVATEVIETDTSSSTSSCSTSTWRHQNNESQIAQIARKKLVSLKFMGEVDGARFIKEFEKLVDRVQPDMSDDDKRLLLTTSFTGGIVNVWYEELDVDDSMPYEELKVALIGAFKGMSRRSKKLDGGALLDL